MIPAFDERGLLPPGDHEVTFEELRQSVLIEGPAGRGGSDWDAAWRFHLAERAEVLCGQLWQAGITEIYLDGSFVEDKPHPNDIDGYFVCDFRDFVTRKLERRLNDLDPHGIWTWDPAARRPYRGYTKLQLPMWHVYRVELYPHHGDGPRTGIRSPDGYERLFPAAFRHRRDTDESRGIVKVVPLPANDSPGEQSIAQ